MRSLGHAEQPQSGRGIAHPVRGRPVVDDLDPVLGEVVRSRRELATHAAAERDREASRRVEAERARIARELHDVLARTLAAVNVQTAAAAAALDTRPEVARSSLEQARASTRTALVELRDDPDGDPAPTLDRLDELAAVARSAGLGVTVELDPATTVSDVVGLAAYRIGQEAITNTIRPSDASHVTIAILATDDALRFVSSWTSIMGSTVRRAPDRRIARTQVPRTADAVARLVLARAGRRAGSGTVRAVTKRLTVVVSGVLMLGAVGCGGIDQAEGSPLCDALAVEVAGIDDITWENGLTRERASWATLLDSGILQADEPSRRAAAEAVAGDADGFADVVNAAPDSLRPQLERLREVVLDPDTVVVARSDEAVVASIEAVRAASPPEVCGWAR